MTPEEKMKSKIQEWGYESNLDGRTKYLQYIDPDDAIDVMKEYGIRLREECMKRYYDNLPLPPEDGIRSEFWNTIGILIKNTPEPDMEGVKE